MASRGGADGRLSTLYRRQSTFGGEEDLKFMRRECFRKVRKEDNPDVCYCGRPIGHEEPVVQREEDDEPKEPKNHQWHPATHTLGKPTNAAGKLIFKESKFTAEYVRIGFERDDDQAKISNSVPWKNKKLLWKVEDHLLKTWKLCQPKLLVSITGGNLRLSVDHKEIIRRGIMKVLMTRDSWLITGGVNDEITTFISEPVRKFQDTNSIESRLPKLELLGVAPWGMLEHMASLEAPARSNLDGVVVESTQRYSGELLYPECHQKYLILVDDGTVRKPRREVCLRDALHKHLMGNRFDGDDGDLVSEASDDYKNKPEKATQTNRPCEESLIPSVFIVIEGDRYDLRLARMAVEGNTPVPVIVVRGSGGVADFIAAAHSEVTAIQSLRGQIDPKRCEADARLLLNLSNTSDQKYKKIQSDLEKLLKKPHLVTVYEGLKTSSFDDTICEAFLKAKLLAKLSLTKETLSKWGVKEINDIPKATQRVAFKPDENTILDAALDALVFDNAGFLNVLFDLGLKPKQLVENENLTMLYSRKYCSEFYEELVEDKLFHSLKRKNASQMKKAVLEILNISYGNKPSSDLQGEKDQMKDASFYCKELFLWALLNNCPLVAEVFWEKTDDPMSSALFASVLLSKMAETHMVEADRANLLGLADVFERRAYEVLTVCYERDKEISHYLLMKQGVWPWWNNSPISWASTHGKTKFMTHPACLAYMKRVWYGGIDVDTSMFWIVCAALCPITFFLLGYKKPTQELFRNNNPLPDDGSSSGKNRWKRKSRVDNAPNGVVPTNEAPKPLEKETQLDFGKRSLMFFFSPVVKFCYHTFAYCVFLVLFSYFVIVDLSISITSTEIVVWIWVVSLFMEEFRQFLSHVSQSSFKKAVKDYFSNHWNVLDLLILFLFLLAFILRFSLNDSRFEVARVFYCLTLIMYYIRLLQSFYAFKITGTTVIMMQEMLTKDLSVIFTIIIVFIFSYGVAAQALIYPESKAEWSLLRNVILLPYWQMYGELDIEEAGKEWYVLVLLAVYLLFVALMLVNILIAMFSNTYAIIKADSEGQWWSRRRDLVTEYRHKPFLPPPLIIVNILVWRLIYEQCQEQCTEKTSVSNFDNLDENMVITPDVLKRLGNFEQVTTEIFGKGDVLKSRKTRTIHQTLEPEHVLTEMETIGQRLENLYTRERLAQKHQEETELKQTKVVSGVHHKDEEKDHEKDYDNDDDNDDCQDVLLNMQVIKVNNKLDDIQDAIRGLHGKIDSLHILDEAGMTIEESTLPMHGPGAVH